MKRIVPILATLAVLVAPHARASHHLTAVGGASFEDGRCLFVSGAADRLWVIAYWTDAEPIAAGMCSEDDQHVDLTPTCRAGTLPGYVVPRAGDPAVLYASVRRGNATYLFKFLDHGPLELDAAGVLTQTGLPAQDGACGASAVPTTPVASGGFTIVVGV